MSEMIGRAAFNVRHLRRDKCGGSTRGDRSRVLNECMRELDPENLKYQAQRNPNIVKADAHLNVAFVNDGKGGVRRATSVDEVLAYQDARMEGVRVRQDSFETSMFVIHLPKSMCEEVPDYYTSIEDGQVVKRPRLVPKDYKKSKRYLLETMFWIADNFIPGGRAAISGGDINFDESTPHIQFMADTFSPDPKNPGQLRCAPGIAYSTHPDVRYVDGPKRGQQIAGQVKMMQAQKGLREHMHALGYPVELEVSERHDESLNLDRFQKIEDQKRLLEQREQVVASAETILQEDREAAQRLGFDDGVHMGRKEGFDQGLADTQADRDAAAADRQAAAEELQRARETVRRQVESARRKAREQAEEEAKQIKTAAQAEVSQKLAEANNKLVEATQELEEAEMDKSAARSDRAQAATELDKAKTVHEKAKREAQSFVKTSREQTMIQARNDIEAAKADRDAAAQERAQAAQERAAATADADDILKAAQAKVADIIEQAKKKALAGAKAARDRMLVVDSEFLDYMLKQPGVQDMYDKFVDRAFANPLLGGNPVRNARTVAQDRAFLDRQRQRSQESLQRTEQRRKGGPQMGG